jgi:hypothetical protein
MLCQRITDGIGERWIIIFLCIAMYFLAGIMWFSRSDCFPD